MRKHEHGLWWETVGIYVGGNHIHHSDKTVIITISEHNVNSLYVLLMRKAWHLVLYKDIDQILPTWTNALQNGCYMYIHWTRVLNYVVIT